MDRLKLLVGVLSGVMGGPFNISAKTGAVEDAKSDRDQGSEETGEEE